MGPGEEWSTSPPIELSGLWVTRTSSTPRDQAVFMDESADPLRRDRAQDTVYPDMTVDTALAVTPAVMKLRVPSWSSGPIDPSSNVACGVPGPHLGS